MQNIKISSQLDAIAQSKHARRPEIQVHDCIRQERDMWDEFPTYYITASEGDRLFELWVTNEYGTLIYDAPELTGPDSLFGWTQQDELYMHLEQAIADLEAYEPAEVQA